MTYEEAHETISAMLEVTARAFRKQIPLKITYDRYCTCCGLDVKRIKGIGDYCFRCGQRLDWSDDNGET